MKKVCYLFALCLSNILFAQTVSITGLSNVEVGENNFYTFIFNSGTSTSIYNGYQVRLWEVNSPGASINNTNSSLYQNTFDENQTRAMSESASITIPIKWFDGTRFNEKLFFKVGYRYQQTNGSWTSTEYVEYFVTFNGSTTKGFDINVNRIFQPQVSTPTIQSCCAGQIQFLATQYGYANTFNWTNMVGGTIVAGWGTPSITVQSAVDVNFISFDLIVGRAQNQGYLKTVSKYISKTSRTATFNSIPVGQNFVCKSGGLQFATDDQCGIDSVVWNAPNCSVSSELVAGGKRQVTITPNASVIGGTIINVNASINFLGGCTVTTPSKSYFIYDNSIPPIPVGSASGNSTPSGVANAPFYTFRFVPTGIYTAGQITIDPSEVERQVQSFNQVVSVCYFNPCTGVRTCKNFTARVPGRGTSCTGCPQLQWRLGNTQEKNGQFNLYPNPTTGLIIVNLNNSTTGDYKIYDLTGKLIIESKFTKQTDLQIDLSNLQNDPYILTVNTENDIFIKKLILKNP